jgi:hypothetical protein
MSPYLENARITFRMRDPNAPPPRMGSAPRRRY